MMKKLFFLFSLFRDRLTDLRSAGVLSPKRQDSGNMILFRVFTVALFLLSTGAFAQFTDGNLTVFKVTNASGALANTGTTIVAEEYLSSGSQSSPNYSITLPTGANGVVISGTASSAGAMTRSENGRYLIVPGYAAAVGDANSTFSTNGTARTLSGNGSFGLGVKGSIYTTSNDLRGAVSDDGTNYWFSGGSLGTRYTNNGTAVTTIQSGTTTSYVNTRVVNIFNGQLFYSTASGTPSAGIYQVGAGKPTTSGQAATILSAPSAPYGFSISPDGLTIYSVNTTNTVVRYTYSGSYNAATFTYSGGSWSTASTGFTLTAVTGVAVDWTNYSFSTSTNGAVVYAVNRTLLVKGADNGSAAITTTTLRTLTGNNAFCGVAFSPVKQTVSKSTASPVASNIQGATTNTVLFGFTLTADEGNSTIKKLILNQSGTATIGSGNDISNFRLIEDTNNNGIADAGEISAALATGTVNGSNITFAAISTTNITQGSQKNLLVLGDVSATATTGRTFIPGIVSDKTVNAVNYTTNLGNGSGSYVTIGTTVPTGAALTIINSPAIFYTGVLAALTTIQGTASATTSFSVSGQTLTEAISINPPTGFEISTTSDFSSNVGTNGSPIAVGAAGTVASTTVYVRLAATTPVGTYSGDIIASSAGASSVNIATASSTVTAAALANQTITFPAIANATYGDAPFAAGATASSGLAVIYTSSDNSIATVSGSTVTITGPGTVSIYADQNGNNAYNPAPQVGSTFTVAAKNLTVSGAAVTSKIYDTTTAATITGATLIGVVDGDTVTVSGAGAFDDANAGENKTVTASLVLGGTDNAKYSLTQPVLTGTITKADQVITFGAIPNKTILDADFSAGATSATSGTNGIAYSSSDTSVATITGNNIHTEGEGTTTITASQAASQNYNAASATQTLTVIEAKFTTGNIVVLKVGTGSAALSSVATPVYFSEYTTDGTATVSIPVPTANSGNRLVMSGSASSEGQMNLSGDGQYLTIAGYDAAVGTTGIASTTSTAANRVIARISANAQVAVTSLGTTPFSGNNVRSAVTQDGSRYWAAGAAGSVYTIESASTTPTLVATTPSNSRTVSIFNNQLFVSTGSGTPGVFKVGSGLPTTSATSTIYLSSGAVATVDPYAYSIIKRSETQWDIYVASAASGKGVYKWSSTDGVNWTAQGNIAIASVSLYGIAARLNTDGNVEIYASSLSNIYKTTDTTAFDATLTGSGLTFTSIAAAPANTGFRGIAFAPTLLAPVITNTNLAISASLNVAIEDYAITANNAAAGYSATGLPEGVTINTQTGVISGTPLHAGTYNATISATNAAGTDTKTLTITVAKGDQVIVFNTLDPKDINDPDFVLTATSLTMAINPITYTSSNTAVATVTGATVHITGVGSTVITASQPANSDYNAAVSVNQTLVVTSASLTDQAIAFNALADQTYGNPSFELTATASSGLAVTYVSSNPAIASISGNVVTILNTGTVNITASQQGDGTYNAATDVVQPLNILAKPLTVTNAAVTSKTYNGLANATVTGGTLNGIVGNDDVTLVNGGGTFTSINAASDIPVTTAFSLSGAQAYRYIVVQPAVTGTITKADQAITFAAFPIKSNLEPASTLTSFSTSSSVNPVSYTSSNPAVATVTSATVNSVTTYTLTVVGTGTATIIAAQAESQNYNAATAGQVLTVQPGLYLDQFTGVSACPTNGNVASVPLNATGSEVSRSSTMTCQSTGNVFNSTTLNATATANDASYIEFSVSAAAGHKLNLSSLYLFRQASNSAPNQLEIRYSTDGFTTSGYTQYTAPVSPTVGTYITWDFADFTTDLGGTVTFRLYPYGTQRADLTGTSAASGTFRIDDVTVFGTIAEDCYDWTGTADSNWTNTANWCGGVIPSATSDVTIAPTANNPVISTGLAHAHNLTVGQGATLTVAAGATLSVENILSVHPEGTLTISNNGALLQAATATANTNVGKITIHKNSNPLYRLDYTMWSSPVDGQNLALFSPATSTNRFYEYKYALNSSNEWIEGYWPVTPGTTNFAAAKGYLIRMPNSISTLTGYAEGTASSVLDGTFTGTPNNGTVNIDLSILHNRYTAVGNPYPSPISVSDFFAANSTKLYSATGLYLWRKRNNSASSSYATLTQAGYVANPDDATTSAANIGSFYQGAASTWMISQGQGFIVRTVGDSFTTAPQLTFTNSMRRAAQGTNQGFFKSAQSTDSKLWLNLTAESGSASQAMVAYMEAEGTPGLDYGYDGLKLTDGNTVALYSLAESTPLAIQARPGFNAGDVVPMGFAAPAAGQYTISLDHTEGVFSQGQAIYLRDNAEGIIRNMGTNDYSFTTEAGTFEGRFDVIYTTTALGTDNPVLDPNTVVVYKQGNTISINTGTAMMNGVTIFDIRGRQLYNAGGINATETAVSNLNIAQQVIIVEIDTVKGKVSKRIVF